MRSRCCSNTNAATPSLLDQINCFRAPHMNDRQITASFARKLKRDPNRPEFRFHRARVEIIPPANLPFASPLFNQRLGHFIIFGMHSDGSTTSDADLHSTLTHSGVRRRTDTRPASTH